MLPLEPESGKEPGLRLRWGGGGSLRPWRRELGEQMGQEDGSLPGRGLYHHLLHRPHPHFGFWAEPRIKKSNHQFFSY